MRFRRSAALPQLELRETQDGRSLCYQPHAHDSFSIGLIDSGSCLYQHGRQQHRVGSGTLVLMNADEVHACRSQTPDQAWGFRMLYLDAAWLARWQRGLASGEPGDGTRARPLNAALSRDPRLRQTLVRLCQHITQMPADALAQQQALEDLLLVLHQQLPPQAPAPLRRDGRLERAQALIQERFREPLQLQEIAQAACLSTSQLVRLFRQHLGLTPHALVMNRRIEYSRAQLRQGRRPAEVALAAGFADQAHWQRAFRRQMVLTPGQYLRG